MKLQYIYRYNEDTNRHTIDLYHDGEFIRNSGWFDDNEASKYLNKLKKYGYTPAFIDEDIESARMEYEYMLEHRLMKKERQYEQRTDG